MKKSALYAMNALPVYQENKIVSAVAHRLNACDGGMVDRWRVKLRRHKRTATVFGRTPVKENANNFALFRQTEPASGKLNARIEWACTPEFRMSHYRRCRLKQLNDVPRPPIPSMGKGNMPSPTHSMPGPMHLRGASESSWERRPHRPGFFFEHLPTSFIFF